MTSLEFARRIRRELISRVKHTKTATTLDEQDAITTTHGYKTRKQIDYIDIDERLQESKDR